jgi:hypothetical protein
VISSLEGTTLGVWISRGEEKIQLIGKLYCAVVTGYPANPNG